MDIAETITSIGKSIEEFKAQQEQRLKKIEERSDVGLAKRIEALELEHRNLENILARPGNGGGFMPTGNAAPLPAVRPGQLRLLERQHRVADLHPERVTEDDRHLNIGKIVKGLATNNWDDADLEKRTMSQTPGTSGGYLMPEYLSSTIIDLARSKSVVLAAGARTLPIEGQNLRIATLESDPTAYWRAENVAITASDATFGYRDLIPRTLGILCKMSVEVVEDAQNLGAVVENALSQAIAVELDRACLFGTGAGQPLGVYGYPGVQEVTTVGVPTAGTNPFSHILSGIENTLTANYTGPLTDLACIIHPRDWTLLESLADSNYNPLAMPKSVGALRWLITTQIPVDQTVGGNSDCSTTFVGSFAECIVGMRTQLTIEATRVGADSDSSAFTNMQVWIRGYLRADFAIGRPAMITKCTGVRTGA